jgi:NAD(P)H dehydrogenase (quinone)
MKIIMAKVAIIFYSATGTTYELARAVEAGAKEAGAETKLLKVKETVPEGVINSNEGWKKNAEATKNVGEATPGDLEWADAIVFGTPTRYGGAASQLRAFIDSTGGLWARGALIDKIGSSFTSAATLHGGHENTILSLNSVFYHWGMLVVSPGYNDPIQFQMGNPYGVSHTSNNGTIPPDETAIAAARFQGKRVAEVTNQFLKGK